MAEVDHTYWFLSRSAGLVAYLLMFVSCVMGLTMTGGVLERTLRRYRVYDLHRFVSLITLAIVAFHVLIILGDGYFSFTVVELLVPFASPYRPLWTALGVLSLYLTAFVIATFYLRWLVPYRAWRLLHYLTFAAFVTACAHGLGAGTETAALGFKLMYAATATVISSMVAYRVVRGRARGLEPRSGAAPARERASVTSS